MMRDGGHGDRVSQFVPIKWLVALSIVSQLPHLPSLLPAVSSNGLLSNLALHSSNVFKTSCVTLPLFLLCPTLRICSLSATPSLSSVSRLQALKFTYLGLVKHPKPSSPQALCQAPQHLRDSRSQIFLAAQRACDDFHHSESG